MEADARTRAQMLDSETESRRRELFGDLEKEKDALDDEVEKLRSFEREYRSRLKSYFTEQLEALDGNGDGGAAAQRRRCAARAEAAQSILGDEASGAESRRTTSREAASRPVGRPARVAVSLTYVERRARGRCRPGRRPSAESAVDHLGGQHLAGDSVGVLARAPRPARPVGLPGQRDPVGDLEAAVLAGLLDQPDHLAGQAGAAQLGR